MISRSLSFSPPTTGISAALVEIVYESILQDTDKHVCTITFAQPATAALATLELNTKGLQEITSAVITCKAPPLMPLNWENQTVFEPLVSNVFTMPAYRIV